MHTLTQEIANAAQPGTPSRVVRPLEELQQHRIELTKQLHHFQNEQQRIEMYLRAPRTPQEIASAQRSLDEMMLANSSIQNQLQLNEYEISIARSTTSTAVPDPGPRIPQLPVEYVALYSVFMLVAILPVSLAWARRIWRRASTPVVALPPEMVERMTRMEQAIEATALEVERIGEGQRYVTQLLGEQASALKESSVRASIGEAARVKAVHREVTPH